MKLRQFPILLISLIILFIVSGCAIFDRDQPQDLEVQIATQAAQTQQAQNIIETIVASTLTAMPTSEEKSPGEGVNEGETPPPQPTETATATFLPTDTPEPTLTHTPALSVPLAEVSVATNCRTGPGKIYDQVSVLSVRRQVEVVGRNAAGTYWVVNNPGGTGTCWLWDRYATVTGPTANLPVWDAPPTPTPVSGVTPTPSVVTLKVSVPTNCRVGPGKAYEIVTVLRTGKTVNVVGRHATADFWVIENPAGTGTCWVWGKYANFTGSPGSLPVHTPPTAPTTKPGLTPTPSGVTLKVSVPTNCRVGPGKAYEIVTVLRTGKTVNVVGRHATADFWVIENPAGTGTCWVWGEYATFTGSPGSLPVHTPPAAPTTKPGLTPTPSSVTLKVSVDTNCRTGPGKIYDIVTVFRIGKTAEVIGRGADGEDWVIRNPAGTGHCWVWGKYATLTGPTGSLPIWDIPPTPTPKP